MEKVEQTVQQLPLPGQVGLGQVKPQRQKNPTKKEQERLGRMGMLVLLLVTTLISLGFYLKYKIGEAGIGLPSVPEISIGGSETITIEK